MAEQKTVTQAQLAALLKDATVKSTEAPGTTVGAPHGSTIYELRGGLLMARVPVSSAPRVTITVWKSTCGGC